MNRIKKHENNVHGPTAKSCSMDDVHFDEIKTKYESSYLNQMF